MPRKLGLLRLLLMEEKNKMGKRFLVFFSLAMYILGHVMGRKLWKKREKYLFLAPRSPFWVKKRVNVSSGADPHELF